MDKVEQDRTPLLITRQNGTPAVLISLDEYNAYMETAHLAASPKNAERLNRAIAQLEAKRGVVRELVEPTESFCVGLMMHGMIICIGNNQTVEY